MWVELDHPQRGKWFNVGMPIKLSASPAKIERSPTLGEHTDEVLKEVLGYSEEQIGEPEERGRVFSCRRRKQPRAALTSVGLRLLSGVIVTVPVSNLLSAAPYPSRIQSRKAETSENCDHRTAGLW